MKTWQLLVGGVLVAGVGAAVFFATRRAAAADAGKRAFRVDAGCTKVETLDVDAAKAAVNAAALAEFRSKDERAIDFFARVVKIVIGCTPNDATMFVGVPGVGGGLSWGSLRSMVGDKTVAEIGTEIAAGGMQMAMAHGHAPSPRPDLSQIAEWLVPKDMIVALRRLASEVPVPFVPLGYTPPQGERWYAWGDAAIMIRKIAGRWQAKTYLLAFAGPNGAPSVDFDHDLIDTYEPEAFADGLAESDVLYLVKIMSELRVQQELRGRG